MSAEAASPFQALADPTRRAILALLRSGSRTAGEIAEAIPSLSKPTLSHHFRVLTAAGLVRAERRGTFIVYTLQTNVLEDLAAQILGLTQGLRSDMWDPLESTCRHASLSIL